MQLGKVLIAMMDVKHVLLCEKNEKMFLIRFKIFILFAKKYEERAL
jgi:hypothetical protein